MEQIGHLLTVMLQSQTLIMKSQSIWFECVSLSLLVSANNVMLIFPLVVGMLQKCPSIDDFVVSDLDLDQKFGSGLWNFPHEFWIMEMPWIFSKSSQ